MPEEYESPEELGGEPVHDPEVLDWEDALRKPGVERPPSDSPYLNDSTIDDILGADTRNEAVPDIGIEQKLSNIEKRLTRLIYDIAILSHGGYLDDIEQNWECLKKTPDHMSLALRNAHQRDMATYENEFHFDLGFDIGLTLSALTGTLSEDNRASEFLAGLREAYTIDEIEKQTHEMVNEEDGDDAQYYMGRRAPQEPTIENVLEKKGIANTPYIRLLIKDYRNALDNVDGMPSLSKTEASRRYIEECVRDFFLKCSKVRRNMDEEWRTIVDASVPGIEVDEILNALWKEVYRNESKSACNKDIRNNIEYDSRKSKLVTQSLNRLSKEGKNPSKEAQTTFEHSEIVYYHNGWELTDYGRLLCYYVFEQSQSTQWVQRTALQTEPIVSNKNPNEYNYSGREILEAGVDDCLND